MSNNLPLISPDQNAVLETLKRLDWSPEKAWDFGQKVLGEYLTYNRHAPKMDRGMRAWTRGVTVLREILEPHGWVARCQGNVELVVHPEKNLAIYACSGDKYVGLSSGEPRNRNKKGSESASLVLQNQRQLRLPLIFDIEKEDTDNLYTWFLFYFFDKEERELRMELSFPLRYNQEKREVYGYKERIIFPPIPSEDSFIPNVDEDLSTDNDFTIVRRDE